MGEAMNAPAITSDDRTQLHRALELARGGAGQVSPNPLVGAVIVRDGAILGEGFHASLGGPHAERAALEDCVRRGHDPAGATLYVSVEPCAHTGRQPPCTEAIVEAGIARVVIGSDDPDERASGRGPGILRDEGIEVAFADGAEAAAARLANQAFRKHARTGLPHVILKSAMSLDGRTATPSGDSKWISGAASRERVHRWRAEVDAVAVGIGTALADDPLLTAREVGAARQPLRIVFDSQARLPLDSKLVRTLDEAPVVVVAAPDSDSGRSDALSAAGVEVMTVSGDGPARVSAALRELGSRDVSSVLVEGGARLAGSFFDSGETDELRLFVAPVLLGGSGSRPLLEGTGAARIADATRALSLESESSGEDVLITARMREW
jgi:diaminohydroxyphosphoribosylaminopyrimidine deaminase/5-amino-6-(5-phosphoribosylamino)uracil reductase